MIKKDTGQFGLPERGDQLLSYMTAGSPCVGVEVGVWRGDLSRYLLQRNELLVLQMVDSWAPTNEESPYAQSEDPHATLDLIDHLDCYRQACINVAEFRSRAHLHRWPSPLAASLFDDGSFDWVFIDGDHSYEGALADIRAWLPKIKPGGWMAGHDYENPYYPRTGVKQAVDEVFGGRHTLGADMIWHVADPRALD